MSKEDMDGVWRTIRGRRIFIAEGQSLGEAMSKSGKFSRDSLRQDKDVIRYKDRSSRFGKNDKLDRKSHNKIVSKNSNTDTDYFYNRDNQATKNRINENEERRAGNTREQKNYFRYSEADRRELSHEKIQKKLADYKNNKIHEHGWTIAQEEALRINDKSYLDEKFNAKRREQSKKDKVMSKAKKIENYVKQKQSNNKVEDNYYKGTQRWGFGYANDDNIPVYNNNIDYTGDFTHAKLSKVSDDDLQKIIDKQTELYNEASNRQVGDRRTYNGRKDQLFKDVETLRYSNGMKVAKDEKIRRENEKHPQYKGTDYEVKYASVKDAINDPNSKINQFIKKKQSNRKVATEIKDGKAIRNENAPITKYNDYNKNEEKYRENLSREIAKELNASMKYASENKLEKEAGSIRSYVDGEVLSKGEKPYTNIYGGLERSTKSLENWLKRLRKGK